ncbi:PREDICTED: uncharacterized protein LOC108761273 [Trachymyrmex cornetzi]|uniref:uncharacterized protein LOC108761273 n=1 Tax=Trachymyrmex cornetzi TaxID=471704 RepID=UPI00084EDED3|nr:PREDICTED: uncharacterized protein LOC108761273 [Trachymyrmex cornetzi]
MANTLLQGNLNRARNAQDILAQTMMENDVGLAVIAEPYRIPVHPHWAGERGCGHLLASDTLPLTRVYAGRGFVTIKWGDMFVTGVYISPSLARPEFEKILEDLAKHLQSYVSSPMIVAGDFNFRSTL